MQNNSSNPLSDILNVDEANKAIDLKDQERYKNQKIKNLLIIVGDRNRKQITILIFLAIIGFIQTFILNSLSYIFYIPSFECISEEGDNYLCPSKEACSNDSGYNLISSIYSLNMKFDLVCENDYKASMAAIFILLVSGGMSCLLFILVDLIGRFRMYFFSTFLQVIGLLICLFSSSSFEMIVIGLTISFSGHYIWFANTYIYVNKKWK